MVILQTQKAILVGKEADVKELRSRHSTLEQQVAASEKEIQNFIPVYLRGEGPLEKRDIEKRRNDLIEERLLLEG